MKASMKKASAVILSLALVLPMTTTVSDAKGSIKLNKKTVTLYEGSSFKLKVKNAPATAKTIYKSNNTSVAVVTKKGNIKAKKEGTALISVTVKAQKKQQYKPIKKLSCRVNVMRGVIGPSPEPTYVPDVDPKFTGDKDAEISDDFITQTMDFSVGLFRASAAEAIAQGENVMISPYSVLTDMMMATNGAGTTNLAELSNVMCGKVGFEAFRKNLSDLSAKLIYSDRVKFHIANSIWIRDDADRIQVKQEFLDSCKEWYNAESFVLPFDAAMADQVNAWVNLHTFGMIPVLMQDPPPEDDVMHLINALAFDGAWAQPYEKFQIAEDQDFTNAKGEKEKATMLCDTIGSYKYDDQAVGFVRYYNGGDYALLTILPNKDVGVEKYLKDFNGAKYKAFYNSWSSGLYDVHTKLPKFSYDYTTELNNPLKEMGIREAFSEGADFKGMADTKSGALYIGKVTHKTHIELDENGTKAAAVTDIGMSDATSVDPALKKEINIFLDRPFIYAIVHTDTGIPVFIGVVNSTKSE